jgi:Zn-dependent protease
VNGSLQIGSVFGIPIRLHWTFLLIAVPALLAGRFLILLVLFGCVLLHELGHSLVARRFGIRVLDITFWPLGGMARMSDLPEDARAEASIALAGPAVNFLLLGLAAGLFVLGALLGSAPLVAAAIPFAWVNFALGTFNLVPAFPMDGGRVLRAWFARRDHWGVATEKAVRVGRWIAAGMLFLPFLAASFLPAASGMPCSILLIAVFVWLMGTRELMAVRVRHGLPPIGRRGAFAWSRPAEPVEPAAPRPSAPRPREETARVGEARRPAVWDASSEGLDEEGLRALERFPGRLRRAAPDD